MKMPGLRNLNLNEIRNPNASLGMLSTFISIRCQIAQLFKCFDLHCIVSGKWKVDMNVDVGVGYTYNAGLATAPSFQVHLHSKLKADIESCVAV